MLGLFVVSFISENFLIIRRLVFQNKCLFAVFIILLGSYFDLLLFQVENGFDN